LTTAQLVALGTTNIGVLETADIAAFTTAQVAALTTAQVVALTSDQIGGLSVTQIAAFSSAQIGAVETADITALGVTGIGGIEVADIVGVTTSQIAAMTTAQVVAFSEDQYNAMSDAQKTAYAANNTPLVLDLDGNGIQTLSAQNGVIFDVNNDGVVEKTGWVSRTDGLLVRDINRDGIINNGGELFGEGTVLANGSKAADGYVALSAIDSNLDGVIDAKDAAFSQLLVWTDKDSDGISDTGELASLSDAGIASLSLNATASTEMNNGNLLGLMGSFTTTDGVTHTMGDVWFSVDQSGNRVFDLAAIAETAGHLTKVNLAAVGGANDTLQVKLADVLSFGEADVISGTSQVTIDGGAGDTVVLSNAGSGWSLAGSTSDGGESYMVYVNDNAQLLVNDKIHTIIV
jgi:hypothetical protein